MQKFISKSPKLAIFTLVALFVSIIWIVKAKPHGKRKTTNPAFAAYISAFSSNVIMRNEAFVVKLNKPIGDSASVLSNSDLFDISPSVKGKVEITDAYTISFKPEKPLPRHTEFTVKFNLAAIIKDIAADLSTFEFYTQTIQQAFEVSNTHMYATDAVNYKYVNAKGTLLSADFEEEQLIEALLTATVGKTTYKINWQHHADGVTHDFTIDSLERTNTNYTLNIAYNGKAIEAKNEGVVKLDIPSLNEFKVLQVEAQNKEEQFISVFFSDPIQPNQDLAGLLRVDEMADLRFSIFNNQIKIYADAQFIGIKTVKINTGISNTIGNKLALGSVHTVTFNNELPAVNIVGKGVIMPDEGKCLFPFEATNLSAVDVSIVKIFEQNIPQFLQVNTLEGTNELRRVGQPLLKKKVLLGKNKLTDLNRSNRFAIDLAQVMHPEPGAIYHVEISFKKAYSLYTCAKDTNATKPTLVSQDEDLETMAEWDNSENYNEEEYDEYYWPDDYNWEERDNPCHNSYYNSQRWLKRNILSSNIGLIAKRGSNGMLFISANNIKTTQPLSGAKLRILNYQQIEIANANTDAQGWATVKVNQKPYLLIATYNNQKSYLRLDENTALNLSRFDIGGQAITRGLKGFLYAERGVWRPGDSLFFNFILNDKGKTLPEDAPIVFELYNPQGQIHRRIVNNNGLNNFYNFTTTTDDNAPTGNWLAKVRVGNAYFEKNVRIETVVPNRLKINLSFPNKVLSKNKALNGELSSAWLHGAIASNFKATIDATFSISREPVKGYENYTFTDESKKLQAESERIFDGSLNAEGKAIIGGSLAAGENAPGMLNINFLTKVFEPGGGFSTDRFSETYHPYSEYIGIKLPNLSNPYDYYETNNNIAVDLACINQLEEPVYGTSNVNIKIYKIEYRWWWDRSDENLSDYANNQYNQLIKNDNISIQNGKGVYNFMVNYPEWGRYMLVATNLKTNHSSSSTFYLDWPNSYSRSNRGDASEATMLSFSTNKNDYKVGEEVVVKFPSTGGGRALISVENGTEVVKTYWTSLKNGETTFAFKATKEMLPNAFVHISLLQPHEQVKNDLPIRLYGIKPIAVSDAETVLKPVIKTAEVLRPDETQYAEISEANGRAMTYTLAIVDEGLLDLTRFKTPDPHATFYAREALGVQTNDLYDFVMNAFSIEMDKVLSIGGDEGLNKKKKDNKANRFKPVVRFLGPFYLPKGKKEKIPFVLPTYYGSVRLMVVAGQEGAYGQAEKAVPVRKPLMMLASLPRVLGINETVKLPVSIFAMENSIKNATVSVTCNYLLNVNGAASKTIYFAKPGEETLDFDLAIKGVTGIAVINLKASNGKQVITESIEIDIRNPNPVITNVTEAFMKKNKSYQGSITPIGASNISTASVEVSSIPPINLGKRLDYLMQYPHGCIEQTTSAVFPQLVLNKLIDLNALQAKQTEENIKKGIERIQLFQTSSGGLAYWPGMTYADEWGTNYAGHFLIEAQRNGYAIPGALLGNWRQFQKRLAQNYTQTEQQNDILQAYRLYTLALAGAAEIGAMNRLKESKMLNTISKWSLAASYALVGQKETALQLINNLSMNVANYNEMSYSYGSAQRDDALILQTLALLGKKSLAMQKAIQISKHLSSNIWLSTQTTAYCLLAMANYTTLNGSSKALQFQLNIDKETKVVNTTASISQTPILFSSRNPKQIKISSTATDNLFVRIINRGQALVAITEEAESNLQMQVQYKDLKGNTINPAVIEQGTDFVCEVKVSNNGNLGNYEQLALSNIFASGWQIHNTRLLGENPLFASSASQYQDIKDDRVYTYFNLGMGKTATYYIMLNASYCGTFYLPPANCEAMYNGSIYAHKKGIWVRVINGKKESL